MADWVSYSGLYVRCSRSRCTFRDHCKHSRKHIYADECSEKCVNFKNAICVPSEFELERLERKQSIKDEEKRRKETMFKKKGERLKRKIDI